MIRSDHRYRNQRQKKRALYHRYLNNGIQSSCTTRSILDKVVEKLIENVANFIANILIVSIILLLWKNYNFLNGRYELIEKIVDIFSKIK